MAVFVASLLCGFLGLYMFLWAFVFGDNLDPEPLARVLAIPFSLIVTFLFWRYATTRNVGPRFLWLSVAASLIGVAFVASWIWL
jgi:hypothetical protein